MTQYRDLRDAIAALVAQEHAHNQDYLATHLPAVLAGSDIRPASLNHSEMQLLSAVGEAAVPYQELTEHVAFSQGLVSRYVKRLLEMQLLLKEPLNKKAYAVRATARGQAVAAIHTAMHAADEARMKRRLASFAPDQIAGALQVLSAMIDQ